MKFKLLIILLMTVLLNACTIEQADPPPVDPMADVVVEEHCSTPEERRALADFIVACATAANPKADEEGEDLVVQCESTGTDVLCPTHHHRWRGTEGNRRAYYDELGPNVPVAQPAVVKPASNHVFFSTDEKGNIVNPRKLDANGKLVPAPEFKDKS